ncbi:MAG: hypothetical protein RJA41_594 [Actinomycetota bacterium]
MSLSDREQRMLDEMERQLYAEDPRFASNLRKQASPRTAKTGLAALITLAGVISIGVGLTMNQPLLGVAGFIGVLFGLYEIIMASVRRGDSAVQTQTKKERKSMTKKAEERFRKRQEGDL